MLNPQLLSMIRYNFEEAKKKKTLNKNWGFQSSAEKEGFEPPDLLQSTVFKTAAFDRSAISPVCNNLFLIAGAKIKCFFDSENFFDTICTENNSMTKKERLSIKIVGFKVMRWRWGIRVNVVSTGVVNSLLRQYWLW